MEYGVWYTSIKYNGTFEHHFRIIATAEHATYINRQRSTPVTELCAATLSSHHIDKSISPGTAIISVSLHERSTYVRQPKYVARYSRQYF